MNQPKVNNPAVHSVDTPTVRDFSLHGGSRYAMVMLKKSGFYEEQDMGIVEDVFYKAVETTYNMTDDECAMFNGAEVLVWLNEVLNTCISEYRKHGGAMTTLRPLNYPNPKGWN
jgi:hypothetical protein